MQSTLGRRMGLRPGRICSASQRSSMGSRRVVAARAQASDTVKVKFHMPYKTLMGDTLAVVGAGEALGNWEVEGSLKLKWTEGDEWVGEVHAPAGSNLEYKYVVVRADGTIEWSPGNNFWLEVASSRGASMNIYEGWVGEGPRHVNVTEPEPGRARSSANHNGDSSSASSVSTASSDPEMDLVSSMVSKLNNATEKLLRVECEAAVTTLLTTYPNIDAPKILRSMQAVMSRAPNMTIEQLQSLLADMAKQEKIVEEEGKFRLPASATKPASNGASSSGRSGSTPTPARAVSPRPGAPTPTRQITPSPKPLAKPFNHIRPGSSSGSSLSASPPVQPSTPSTNYNAGSNGASAYPAFAKSNGNGNHSAAPAPAPAPAPVPTPISASVSPLNSPAPSTAKPVDHVLVPYVMRQLDTYSSMSLERMHSVLGATMEHYSMTTSELEHLLGLLAAEGRVIAAEGQYRKGMATPKLSRTRSASPVASRQAPGPVERAAPAASQAAPAAPAAVSGSSMPQSQFAAYEQQTLRLLSNYSGCTAERLLGQLKGTTDFPGNLQSLIAMMSELENKGRVQNDNGTYRYIPARAATPTAARGASPMPPTSAPRAGTPTISRGAAPAAPAAPAASSNPASSNPAPRAGSPRAQRLDPWSSMIPSHAVPVPAPGPVPVPAPVSQSNGTTARRPRTPSPVGRRKTARRDPNVPKKNQTAYQIFCTDNRPRVKAMYPGLSFGELTRLVAQDWHALSPELRGEYEQLAQADKARYEAELAQALLNAATLALEPAISNGRSAPGNYYSN